MATSIDGVFKYSLLQLEQNTKQCRAFHFLPSQCFKNVTSIEAIRFFLRNPYKID